jgi:hypothetical protein
VPGGLHLHQAAVARSAAQAITGPSTQSSGCQGLDGSEAQIQGRQGDLRHAQNVVEPAFRQIKGPRGLDRFRLRCLENVNGEWALIATTHNLLKLFRTSRAAE